MQKGGDEVNPALAVAGRSRYERGVKNDEPDRAERLAEALRANLRRRKAQSRVQSTVSPDLAPDPAPLADVSAARTV